MLIYPCPVISGRSQIDGVSWVGAIGLAAAMRLCESSGEGGLSLKGTRIGIILSGGNLDITPQLDALLAVARANTP